MRRMLTVLTVFSLCFGVAATWAQDEITPETFRDTVFSDLAGWRHAQAREKLESERAAFGKSTGYSVAWAVMLAQERDFAAAVEALADATCKDPTDPSAPYFLGEVRSWQKADTAVDAWEQARDRAKALVKKNKKDGWAMYWQGSAQIRLGKYSQAEAKLKKALKNGADQAMTEFQLGLALMYREKWDRSREAFDRCLEQDSGFSHAYYFRGRVWQELDNTEQMLLDMDRFLQLAPDAREANAAKSILRAGG